VFSDIVAELLRVLQVLSLWNNYFDKPFQWTRIYFFRIKIVKPSHLFFLISEHILTFVAFDIW
jgi:hypothetical protein